MCVTEEEQNGTCYKAEDCTEKGGKAKVIISIISIIIKLLNFRTLPQPLLLLLGRTIRIIIKIVMYALPIITRSIVGS